MYTRQALRTLIFVLCLLVVGIASAQETETYTGEIVGDRDTDDIVITLNAGDSIIITATSTSVDTILTLRDSDDDTVAENDDYDFPNTTDSRIAYTVETSGDYTIIVNNFSGVGAYEVTVEYVSAERVAVLNGELGDLIGEPDLMFEGELISDEDTDEYTLQLSPEQGIVIDALAVDPAVMDPVLSLSNPDGLEVAFNDDVVPGSVFDSQIVYVPTEEGIYTVIVDNFPDYFGAYELLITYIDPEQASEIIAIGEEIPDTSTTPERDPDEVYTGQLEDNDDTDEYTLELTAGQGIIAAVYETDGRMDTVLSARDPNGREFVFNDDRGDYTTFDSQVAFTAGEAGTYTLVVNNYPGFAGAYRLEIYYTTPEETARAEQALREILSGEVELYETEHFLIHYTTEGVDVAEFDYIEEVADTLEDVLDIQINELGWAMPPSDVGQGGDGRIDVYIRNITGAYGYMSTSSPAGDNPNTAEIETSAQAGYLVLDNDYAGYSDPIQAMRATAAHEFHHVIQYGYDGADFQWYFESTASWMETVTFPEDEEATIYIQDVYDYPEACFGGQGGADPTGLGVYGTWLFLEFISTELGEEAPFILWENIASSDEWEPLERTLATYDETIPSVVSRYHVNNMVRNYILVDSFDDITVSVEDRIDEGDDWQPDSDGVQELGVNIFELDLDDLERGRYEFELRDADNFLEIFVVGIREDDAEADVYMLGEQGTVNLDVYDYAYAMVFNADYNNDLANCRYAQYTLRVQDSFREATSPTFTVDATNFEELD